MGRETNGKKCNVFIEINGETHSLTEWSTIVGRQRNYFSCYYSHYKDIELVKRKLMALLEGDESKQKFTEPQKRKRTKATRDSLDGRFKVTQLVRFVFYNPYKKQIYEHSIQDLCDLLEADVKEIQEYIELKAFDYCECCNFFSWLMNEKFMAEHEVESDFHLKYDWEEYKRRVSSNV